MKKLFAAALIFVFLASFFACGKTPNENAAESTPFHAPDTASDFKAEEIKTMIAGMTIDEKIGQLFFVRPEAAADTDIIPGGYVLFSEHIENPEQLKKLTAELTSSSRIPPAIAIDEEGGRVARIAQKKTFSVKKYDSMEAVGKTKDVNKAYNVGKTIGSYLKEYGITIDFAPVADVNTAGNSVIGNRSFGSDPELVAAMVKREIDGLHEAGVLTCVKHFPGHGDTKEDTHTGEVVLAKDWETLKKCELVPFIETVNSTDCVMAAHITLPSVDNSGLPASLSKTLITEKLRGELGFSGVVITDALEMGAVTSKQSSAETSVLAFEAGCDILLMPEDLKAAFDGIKSAVKDGKITEQRLDESVERILILKQKASLLEYVF